MKHNKLHYFTMAFLFFVLLTSCKKTNDKPNNPDNPIVNPDDPDNPDTPDSEKTFFVSFKNRPTQKIAEISITKNNKNAYLVIVDSDKSWTATSNEDWIKLAAWSGDDKKMGLILGIDENLYIPREATVTFKSGDESQSIKIKQVGAPKINFTVGDVEFSMVYVEGGGFLFGHSDVPEARWSNYVVVDSYYICETEVTNALWLELVQSLPYSKYEDYFTEADIYRENKILNLPVSAVSWDEINNDFLPKLRTALGFDFRLPTEAQWEFAALGGVNNENYTFSEYEELAEIAWVSHRKEPVALLKPNSLGIYDMAGNVAEWCSDWYVSPYEQNPVEITLPNGDTVNATVNPQGPATGTQKVVRGCDFTTSIDWFMKYFPKWRLAIEPSGYNYCWGGNGDNPNEPRCFYADYSGFRFVLPLSK